MTEQAATYVLTAVLSPIACVAVYLFWKTIRETAKIMRRHELEENIKTDYMTRAAIVSLITEKIKEDYLFQQAIIALVTEQLQKDWKLEKAVTSIARKAN